MIIGNISYNHYMHNTLYVYVYVYIYIYIYIEIYVYVYINTVYIIYHIL